MRIWQRIAAWFRTPPRHRAPVLPELHELDPLAIAQELGLKAEAVRLGRGGVPPPEAVQLSGPERQAIQYCENARRTYLGWATGRLSGINATVERSNVLPVVSLALQADQEFIRKANTLIAEVRPLLAALAETKARQRIELEAFRGENRITRDARYPSAAGRFYHLSALVGFVVVEGLLNAKLFAAGVEGGLVSAFVYAALLALCNVLAAAAFGRFVLPYALHAKAPLRVLGILGAIAAVLFVLTMSLTIAHFRDALQAAQEEPARIALATLRQSPLALSDIFSWVLAGLSVVFGIAGLAEGFALGDRYPGYGALSRRTEEAEAAFEDELGNLQAELEALKEKELRELDRATTEARALLSMREDAFLEKAKSAARFSAAMKGAETCVQTLVQMFRDENQLHRNGVKVPEYFHEVPVLEPLDIPDFSTEREKADIEHQRSKVKELLDNHVQKRAAIQSGFAEAFDSLIPLREQLVGKVTRA